MDTPAGPPTPQPPLPVSPPKQKGYQSAPFKILHPSAYSSRPESEVLQSYGAKMETRTPMHIWPTRHPQLACTAPCCFEFLRILLAIYCWHNPGCLEWIAAPLAWRTTRPGPKRVCLWLLDMSKDPPFYPTCSKKMPIDWAWESWWYLKISKKVSQESYRDPPKNQGHIGGPPLSDLTHI